MRGVTQDDEERHYDTVMENEAFGHYDDGINGKKVVKTINVNGNTHWRDMTRKMAMKEPPGPYELELRQIDE